MRANAMATLHIYYLPELQEVQRGHGLKDGNLVHHQLEKHTNKVEVNNYIFNYILLEFFLKRGDEV